MRRLFFLVIILVLSCAWVYPLEAATIGTVPSVIHGLLTLGHDTHTYTLGTTTIAPDGELKVLSGVTLIFDPGAMLEVQGKLTLKGTAKSHIVLMSSEGTTWDGVHSDCTSLVEDVEYVEAESMTSGMQLCSAAITTHDLSLENSERTTLLIGSATQSFDYTPELTMSNIYFIDPLLKNSVQDIGIRFIGTFSKITLDTVSFPPMNQIPEAIWPKLVTMQGTFSVIGLGNGTVGGTCQIEFTDYPQVLGQLGVTSSTCPQAPVPVIFIPGYGTSINLAALTDSTSINNPVLTGWHFIDTLTPQYDHFLAWLTANDVQYKVAYYDWRLPPDKIVTDYLLPVIAQAKLEFHTSVVNIVAHSVGGIIARQYIQSPAYAGDVGTLVQLATPNLGSIKAYSVWEAGSLPSDWAPLTALVRFYQLQHITQTPSITDVIQQFFPSVQWLLPTYDSLLRDGVPVPESSQTWRNTGLDQLQQTVNLLSERVTVVTLASDDQSTPTFQTVGDPKSRAPWRDGKPDGDPLLSPGDGTVSLASAEGISGTHLRTSGSHLNLVETAAPQVIAALYPDQPIVPPTLKSTQPYAPGNTVWFFADCPVAVHITSPSGAEYDSTAESQNASVTLEQDADMLWMGVPYEPGTFTFSLTATADASVRWWVNTDDPTTIDMAAGEQISVVYPEPVQTSLPVSSQTPVPAKAPSATPIPAQAQEPVPISLKIPQIIALPWTAYQFHTVLAVPAAPVKKTVSIPSETAVLRNTHPARRVGTALAVLICAVLLPP